MSSWATVRSFFLGRGRDSESAQAAPDDSDEEGTNAGMSVNPSRAALTARSPSFFGTVRADMSLNPSRAALTARSPSFFGTVRALVQSGHSMGRHDSVKEQRAPAALFVEFDDEQTGKLVEALKEGNVEKCRMAIAAHANPNQSIADARGMSPLHIAALLGRTISSAKKVYNDDVAAELAGQLVKAGGRAVAEDELGYTPVHLAAYSGASLTLHVILDSIAKSKRVAARLINKQDTQIHYTPLHCAVEGRVASTVLALLLRGADTQLKDSTGFTAWNLAATFNTTWAYQLLMSLCMDMAQGRQVPPDALMQLALEMRQLEVVPMLIRATAKWPERVWSLLHAAIASGIQEFVELIVEDIPRLTPTALLHCPWQDVMLELASRFPDCFKQLMHGLDIVSFEDVVIPFVDRLTMRLIERGEEAGEGEEEEASKGGALHKQESMEHVVSPQLANRQKSAVNRSMLQLFNLKSFLGSVSMRPAGTVKRMTEAAKFLLLRNLLNSLDKLSYRVWQRIVTHLDQELMQELSRFPKLFKKLTDSIASRNVPRAVVAASSGLEESEKIKTLSVGPILKAAIASRSSVNVYQVVTAIDKWLQRNTHCYLDELDVDNIQKLAKLYPDACTLLLSIKFQDKVQIKVPSSLLSSGELAYRGSNISQAFVWQDAGLSILLELGLTVDQIERWVIQNIGFELLIKVFQKLPPDYTADDMAADIDYLLDSGIPGLMISKLMLMGTDLLDVKDALEGGLSASFIVHMLHKKISFQVIKEMLGARLDESTVWINVQRNAVWKKFPHVTWCDGLTYAFIRLFFETWEKHNFDKNFIDLMFDFHDPLFVKLRTALEYVASNKTVQVNTAGREERSHFRRKREWAGFKTLIRSFCGYSNFFPHRFFISGLAWVLTKVYNGVSENMSRTHSIAFRSNKILPDDGKAEDPDDEPKADASSEKLPLLNACQMGDRCYLRALLLAKVPAPVFGLPVAEAIVNVKWVSYGWRFMLLQLIEHVLFTAIIVSYLILVTYEEEVCHDHDLLGISYEVGATTLQDLSRCSIGVATFCLDVVIAYMCCFWAYSNMHLITKRGFFLWQMNNTISVVSLILASTTVGFHLARFFEGLVVSLSLLIILDILSFSWYAMMTERLGSLVRVIFEILKETVYFLFLLGMLYSSFALAFFLLQSPGQSYEPLAVQLLTIMFGDFSEAYLVDEVIYGEQFVSPRFAATLMMIYAIMLLIILFNMLVAIMNDTYQRIRSRERVEGLRNKAIILVEMESSLSQAALDDLYNALSGKYLHSIKRTELEHLRERQAEEKSIRNAVREEVTKGVRKQIKQAVTSLEESFTQKRPQSAAPTPKGGRPRSAAFTPNREASQHLSPGVGRNRRMTIDNTFGATSFSRRVGFAGRASVGSTSFGRVGSSSLVRREGVSFSEPKKSGVSFSAGTNVCKRPTYPNPERQSVIGSPAGKRATFEQAGKPPKPPSRPQSSKLPKGGSTSSIPGVKVTRQQSFSSINAELRMAESRKNSMSDIDRVLKSDGEVEQGVQSPVVSPARRRVSIAVPLDHDDDATHNPGDMEVDEEEDRKSRLGEKQKALMKRFGTFGHGNVVMARRMGEGWGGDEPLPPEESESEWMEVDSDEVTPSGPVAMSLNSVATMATAAARLQAVAATALADSKNRARDSPKMAMPRPSHKPPGAIPQLVKAGGPIPRMSIEGSNKIVPVSPAEGSGVRSGGGGSPFGMGRPSHEIRSGDVRSGSNPASPLGLTGALAAAARGSVGGMTASGVSSLGIPGNRFDASLTGEIRTPSIMNPSSHGGSSHGAVMSPPTFPMFDDEDDDEDDAMLNVLMGKGGLSKMGPSQMAGGPTSRGAAPPPGGAEGSNEPSPKSSFTRGISDDEDGEEDEDLLSKASQLTTASSYPIVQPAYLSARAKAKVSGDGDGGGDSESDGDEDMLSEGSQLSSASSYPIVQPVYLSARAKAKVSGDGDGDGAPDGDGDADDDGGAGADGTSAVTGTGDGASGVSAAADGATVGGAASALAAAAAGDAALESESASGQAGRGEAEVDDQPASTSSQDQHQPAPAPAPEDDQPAPAPASTKPASTSSQDQHQPTPAGPRAAATVNYDRGLASPPGMEISMADMLLPSRAAAPPRSSASGASASASGGRPSASGARPSARASGSGALARAAATAAAAAAAGIAAAAAASAVDVGITAKLTTADADAAGAAPVGDAAASTSTGAKPPNLQKVAAASSSSEAKKAKSPKPK